MNGTLISPNLLWIIAATLTVLVTGTVVRLSALRGAAGGLARQHLDSLKSWWLVAALVMACALLGVTATVLLFTVVSGLALREFVRLYFQSGRSESGSSSAASVSPGHRLLWIAYLLIPLNYLWVWLGWERVFLVFLPLATLLLLGSRLVVGGRPEGFVRGVAGLQWGTLLTTYSLSHAVLLFRLPESMNPVAGGAGWFLFLLMLTESNDIAQALVGRRFGKRALAPRISPHKTWEGIFGGVVATVLLAVLLAPWITPLSVWQALLSGLAISASGVFGDLNISALKRDAGVKDSGSMLPGQGGVLDRIDSLTFTAPVFYYLLVII